MWILDVPKSKEVLNTMFTINDIWEISQYHIKAMNPSRTCFADLVMEDIVDDVHKVCNAAVLKRFFNSKTANKLYISLDTGMIRIKRPFSFVKDFPIENDESYLERCEAYTELIAKVEGATEYVDSEEEVNKVLTFEYDAVELTDMLRMLDSPNVIIDLLIDEKGFKLTNESGEFTHTRKVTSEVPITLRLSTHAQKYIWTSMLGEKPKFTLVSNKFFMLNVDDQFKFLTAGMFE